MFSETFTMVKDRSISFFTRKTFFSKCYPYNNGLERVQFRRTKFHFQQSGVFCPYAIFITPLINNFYMLCPYLPGHFSAFGLHDTVWLSFPSLEQSSPPFCGSGLLHNLLRLIVPFFFPQVLEHSPHSPHSP